MISFLFKKSCPFYNISIRSTSKFIEIIENEDANKIENWKLGLLFIIIDELPLEAIWRLWIESSPIHLQNRIEIFFHAKFPNKIKSPWVLERLVKSFHIHAEWASLDLTKIMINMLSEVGTII